jgi:sterol desaturase/sphingolipid hydroxylase (fatty acid hydroxylase superfamily)
VPVRYPRWLGRLVLSPHVHHLHHSRAPEHRDCNFGVIFPYWDRLFGTYRDEAPAALRFGLAPEEDPFGQSVVRCLTYPILRR